MPKPKFPSTQPVYGYLEVEWLMEIILSSGHRNAEYLVEKLVKYAENPEVYARLRQQVLDHITLVAEHGAEPVHLYPPGALQQMLTRRFPEATGFGMVGTTGPDRAITFTTGTRQFYFMAPDGHVGDVQKTRADAQDAFDAYWKPVRRPA